MGKGEIAGNQQFLLFPQCFLLNQITVFLFVHIFDIMYFFFFVAEFEKPKIGISGKGLMTLVRKMFFENTVGKAENGNHHFLLFSQCFLTIQKQVQLLLTENSLNLAILKFCLLVKSQEWQLTPLTCHS